MGMGDYNWGPKPKSSKLDSRNRGESSRESRAKSKDQLESSKRLAESHRRSQELAMEQALGVVERVIQKDSLTAGLKRAKEKNLPRGMIVRLDGTVERVTESFLGIKPEKNS